MSSITICCSTLVERHDQGLQQMRVGKTLLAVTQTAANAGLFVPSDLALLGKTLLQLDELEVKVKAVDANLVMEGFQKIANRITTGIILAALIVGASPLMRVETSFHLMGYPGLAILCFRGAAGGGIWLLISIFVSDQKRKSRPAR